jgi:hypothetical protein
MRGLESRPARLGTFGSKVFHDPDRNAEPSDHVQSPAAKHLITIHMCRCDKEVGMVPIPCPLELWLGLVFKRYPLSTDRDRIADRLGARRTNARQLDIVFNVTPTRTSGTTTNEANAKSKGLTLMFAEMR